MNFGLHRAPSADERLRAEQTEEARLLAASEDKFGGFQAQPRRILTASRPPSRPGFPPSKPTRPLLQGHAAFLKSLEHNNANVIVEKMNGDKVEGLVRHSDKYTITMRCKGVDRVIFKHDISEFMTTTPRPQQTVVTEVTTSEGQQA